MPEGELVVGIAEYKTARDPARLMAYGLGSCVGITLYDRSAKVGGLAHVMLPTSRIHAEITIPGKYADTAIEALLEALGREGTSPKALEAKIVGGANMFNTIATQAVSIGTRNAAAAREKLREKGIPIVAEECGGTQGRTIVFNLSDGKMEIRKFERPSLWL
ncbi:MAG TPA: chemotaxis protein CheD [bacterium]|nr:chemotaxis protein CheD [bacterium]